MPNPRYVSLNLHPPVMDGVRGLIFEISRAQGRRVTNSDLIHALVAMGHDHMDELGARLTQQHEQRQQP